MDAVSLPKPYYERDGITLYHGDSSEILPHVNADVMLTDPPYGGGYSSNRGGQWDGQPIANDHSTDMRDNILSVWGNRPSLVFSDWRHPMLNARASLVWDKGDTSGMGDLSIPWKPNWEVIFVFGNGFSGKRSSGVIRHNSLPGNFTTRLHPNEKPFSLIAELLRKCPPGVVVDPFAGSGTTLLAARDMGRKAIGIEIEEKYCEIAAKRLSQGIIKEFEV